MTATAPQKKGSGGGDGRYRLARKKLIIEFFCGQHAVSTTFEQHGWQAVTGARSKPYLYIRHRAVQQATRANAPSCACLQRCFS